MLACGFFRLSRNDTQLGKGQRQHTSRDSRGLWRKAVAALCPANAAFPIFLSMGAQCQIRQRAVVTASLVTVVAPGVRLDGEQWPSTPWPQLLELISRGTNTIQPLLLPTQTNYWELVTISVCMEQQLFVMVSGWQQTPLTGRSLTCHHGERSFNGNFIWNICPRDDNASVPLPAQVSTSQGAVSDTQHIQSADQLLPPWYFKSKLGVGKVLSYFSFNQFTSIKTWANLSDCTAALPFSRKLD